ncbi:hypothetical protein [Deinococcus radiodurans]|jgi:hypothetical protein|uniref:Uncharacterized protein n=1 Tax=Deinococcus radiodurans (strain ATCC 13939 / DSM 20539 / JCM 16871 / CCUG 27074 / LMG 4051 / NBRC 15346 / NCIMB 9279 / VKM B-1422 / R1) TaxID=243230 RepID=Q9RTC0_DEIRA|nr:hypothetical protein [Deinococcus radiodurans]AAF11401.1 hypothetical protein DR_1845 [Deinococcus radiodurans R1 = ATCC 13939 = DSM 20539]ANC71062.1 hypothetical protein A2G07_04375 [Deinococcus radiodurans R1 = ATCC 13939 = DSM 20539]QEM71259.1 hypothetical protein DXG80_05440 [Deinococcus radiodurans]QIP29800.1 hypothetical protein HAV23_12125 [Deinococcus radiodurans]QIP31521.1 hypothetical protein HAV35_04665 [Deinococcus radiodurans]
MNAESWLRIATADLPEAVAERVRRDTWEHLDDAELDAGADVDPVLGSPEDMTVALKKLYVTRKEWEQLMSPQRPDLRWLHIVCALMLGWMAWTHPSGPLVAAALLYALGYGLSWRLHPLRQDGVLLLLGVLVNALNVTFYLPQLLGVSPAWVYALLAGALVWHAAQFWEKDQKLRRTLRLMA